MADVPPCVAQVSHRSKLRERQKRMFCSDGLLYICPLGLQFLIKCRQRVHVFLPPDGVQTESVGTVDTLTTSAALTHGLALRKRKSCRRNRNESNNAISFFNCNCHCWCTMRTYTYTYVHKWQPQQRFDSGLKSNQPHGCRLHVCKWCDGGVVHTSCEKNSRKAVSLTIFHQYHTIIILSVTLSSRFVVTYSWGSSSCIVSISPIQIFKGSDLSRGSRMLVFTEKLKIIEPWCLFLTKYPPIMLTVIASYGQGAGTVIWLFLSHMTMELLSASDFVLCGDERRLGQ